AGAGFKIHARRQGQDTVGIHHYFLRVAAPAGDGNDPVARLESGYRGAHRVDDAGYFATGGEGRFRFELVFTLDDQGVREVHTAGADANADLLIAKLRARQLLVD